MNDRIFVIARYEENLDWISSLENNVVIYNKSETFNYDFPRHDVPNFGRETESYIRFIIQYYNQLDNFKSVVFLQGDPHDHCKNLFEKLSLSNVDEFKYLSDKNAVSTFPDKNYFKMHLSTMCRLFNVEYDWDIVEFSQSKNDSYGLISSIRHIEHCMSLCYHLGINTENLSYEWASGCQYQVPVKMIKNKTLQWWLDIHNMHTYFSRVKKLDFFGYVIETIWPLLILHNSKGEHHSL